MTPDDKTAQHTSQISRLEQVMTALAEAQVKTKDDTAALKRAMAELAQAQAELAKAQATSLTRMEHAITALAEAQAQTDRQFQAYLKTRPQ